MLGIRPVSLFQVVKLFCMLLLCVFVVTAQPVWASDLSFQDQASNMIEKVQAFQVTGKNMESLRRDRDHIERCAVTMRRLQPQAEELRKQISALEVDESRSDSFQASIAKEFLSAATGNLNLCNSCLRSALDSCKQVSSSLELAMQTLQGE